MTREETVKILALLKVAYPHSFKDITRADAEAMLDLWTMQFREDSMEFVSAAVNALIATRKDGYSPTIGEVKDQMFKLREHDGLSESSAWALVSKACGNGLYGYMEEFAKLPEEVQRAVGAPEQLKAWAMMDAETVESVVASNFMKNYRTLKKRDKDLAILPPEVRSMLSSVGEKLSMEAPKELPKPEPLTLPKMKEDVPKQMPKAEAKEEYKPPSKDEWEQKRQKALESLNI